MRVIDSLREVPGAGPFTAPLLLVGEGPGKTEVARGEPFVGQVGRFMGQCFTLGGMDFVRDTRVNNAVPVKCKVPGSYGGRAAMLAHWWGHLDDDLARMRPRVIVACGALAWQRLGGDGRILRAHGTVVPTTIRAGANEYETLVIPCIHPAAIMRGSKVQAGKLAVARVIERAIKYAKGELTYEPQTPTLQTNPTVDALDLWLAACNEVVIDTEFDPSTRELLVVGMARPDRPYEVVSLTKGHIEGCAATLAKHLSRKELVKVAHYHTADVKALGWAGIDVAEPWFDTLAAFSTLYPDLPCGLSPAARFYLDDINDWKGMDKRDPVYNAIDVMVTARVYDCVRGELTDKGMWDVIEQEVMPTLPLLYGMQERGIDVDRAKLMHVRIKNRRTVRMLHSRVCEQVAGVFEGRKRPLEKEIEAAQREIEEVWERPSGAGGCEQKGHETYSGQRKKKWTSNDKCKCKTIYEQVSVVARRTRTALLRTGITKAAAKIKKWDRGFDPDNNDHVRWLLYDKAALGLPKQRKRATGALTADATAIAKLMTLKATDKKGVRSLLVDIKLLQQAEKMHSTFLKPPVDRAGVVHPPYRMHGTGTGRPAGGDDDWMGEKGGNKYKFNALNIPREGVRRIYVPEAK